MTVAGWLFTEPLPEVSDHFMAACSYLRLGTAYDWAADRAEARGWPVERLASQHLATVTEPTRVADALELSAATT